MGKDYSRQSLELNLLLPFFCLSALSTCHHLTCSPHAWHRFTAVQAACSLNGNAAGTVVEGWFNSQRSRTTLPI